MKWKMRVRFTWGLSTRAQVDGKWVKMMDGGEESLVEADEGLMETMETGDN